MSEIVNFGIYKGLEWEKLSSEYLHGLADMGNMNAKEYLEKRYNSPIETQKIGFGKFSSSLWVEVNTDYLYWILNNVECDDIRFTLAKKALDYIVKHNDNDEFGDVIYVD